MRSRNKGCVIVFFHEEVLKQGTRFGWRPIAEPEDSEADNRARFYIWPRLVATAHDGSPHLPRRAGCCLCCFVRAVHAFGGQCSAATWTNDDPRHTSLNGASRVGMAALNPQVLWMSMLTGSLPFWRCKRGGYTVLRPVLLNESGVEAFREALVRDKAWSETPGPEDTLQRLCTACEDFWIDFMDLCKKSALEKQQQGKKPLKIIAIYFHTSLTLHQQVCKTG
ncbi:uncharacterized protein LOC144149303 isoform X2 [Haemaphysalis longicornis]